MNFTFLIAVLVVILSGKAEYGGDASSGSLIPISLDMGVDVSIVMERIISSVALAVLLVMLAFVLWFPVQMPKNLVFFSFGFIVYFACKTALFLAHSFLPGEVARQVGTFGMLVIDLCFVYWLTAITREGESVPLRIGHRWKKDEQQRLLEQLEGMNAALLRGARK